MALHDIEIVVGVESDVQRLVEHAVPRAVLPFADLATLAYHEERLAARIELPDDVQKAVDDPDVAVPVNSHPVRIDGNIGVEGSDELTRGIIFDHHDRRITVEDDKMPFRC